MTERIDALLSDVRGDRARELAEEKSRLRGRIAGAVAAQVALAATKAAAAKMASTQVASAQVAQTVAAKTAAASSTAASATAKTAAAGTAAKAFLLAHGTKLAVLAVATSAVVYQASKVATSTSLSEGVQRVPTPVHEQDRERAPIEPESAGQHENRERTRLSEEAARPGPRVNPRASIEPPELPASSPTSETPMNAVPPSVVPHVPEDEPEATAPTPVQAPINVEHLRREVQLLARARAEMEQEDFAGAVAELEQHRAIFAQGTLIEEREALLLIAHCRLGDRSPGERERFRRAYPASAYRARITEACRAPSVENPAP